MKTGRCRAEHARNLPSLRILGAVKTLGTAACVLLAACNEDSGARELGRGTTSSYGPTRPARTGFFAFDGTGVTAADENTIKRLHDAARVDEKRYFEGTGIDASNYRSIVENALARICALHRKAPFTEVSLLGYSRGAIAAFEVAGRLAGSGGGSNACGTAVPVRWMGLLDPVDTGIEGSAERGIALRNPVGSTRCFRIKKTRSRDFLDALPGILDTRRIISCETRLIEGSHRDLGYDPEARAALIADARRFRPGLFSTSGASQGLAPQPVPFGPVTVPQSARPSQSETQPGDVRGESGGAGNVCSTRTTLLECFNAGCSWSNGLCTPLSRPR